MQRRPLGKMEVSAVGLGCAGMGRGDEAAAMATMAAALDLGIDFFDTSDLYGVGRGEELIGRFLSGRSGVNVATKFGSMPGAADGVGCGPRTVNNHPDYIIRAAEASLRRLGRDVIDLYYMHRRDPSVPVVESVGAMSRLVEAGKVRWIGLSEVSPATLRAAHSVHPITALQSEYSLWMREPEETVLPVCGELGIGFVPFSPLGRAFLTGTLAVETLSGTDFRATLPRFKGEAAAANRRLVAGLEAFAAARGVTAAQVALAWLLCGDRSGAVCVPIPGTTRPHKAAENAAAVDLALSPAEMAELDTLFAPGAVVGDRYTAEEAARAGT